MGWKSTEARRWSTGLRRTPLRVFAPKEQFASRVSAGLAACLIVGLTFLSVHKYQQAALFSVRENTRASLGKFRQLAEETRFQLANRDEPNEVTPY